MFSLLKRGRARLYPLLLLLVVLLLAGCSQAQPDSADGGPVAPAGSQAAQTLRPEGTAIPSATADGMAASTSGAAPAGATPAPADATPAAAPGVTEQAPVTPVPAPAASAPASGHTGAADQTPAATVKPAVPAPAGTKQPAAAASSAAALRPPATSAPVNTVTLSITGDEEHGVILAPAAYEIETNETALELLKRIARKHKIQMEYQGSKTFAYVEGIDNLYEYDHGAESGWMYRVNGEFPSKASGSWIVQPGDTIEWLYTLDLGKDLGAPAP